MADQVTLDVGIVRTATGGATGKRVLLAEPRGYCAGVDRAVETVERALEKHGAPIYVRKEIVHNRHVVQTLAERGVVFVEGTAGEAPDHVRLVDGPDAVDAVTVRDESKVVWLSQTTLSVDETMATVARLRERFPDLQDPPSDDICYATQNRQVAVKAMAAECDLVIVVGSRNSSNSVRLVEVALGAGAGAAHLVDYAREVDPAWLAGVATIGVTSGASVPEILVRGVLDLLAEHGFGSVLPVTTANETLVFALPRELREARAQR